MATTTTNQNKKRKSGDTIPELCSSTALNEISVRYTWTLPHFKDHIEFMTNKEELYSSDFSIPVESVDPDHSNIKDLSFNLIFQKIDEYGGLYLNSKNDIPLKIKYLLDSPLHPGPAMMFYHIFSGKTAMGVPDVFTLSELRQKLANDETMICSCKIIIFSEKFRAKKISCLGGKESNLSHDLRIIRKDGQLSDVQLQCEGETIACHKAILGARSQVFMAMFSHETAEGKNNIVNIEDIHLNTLNELIDFIYTDETCGLPQNAYDLFCAANKYDVQMLKLKCEETLIETMNVENAADYLVLAYTHESQKLKDASSRYVANHMEEVMKTDGWGNVKETHPKAMHEILQAILLL